MSNNTNTYWNHRGKYESAHALLVALETKLGVVGREQFVLPQNADLALFNGMMGIYYGNYNDGDSVARAIDNNRVHGFSTVEAFKELALSMRAPAELIRYINGVAHSEADLEAAMDAAILLVYKMRLHELLPLQDELKRAALVPALNTLSELAADTDLDADVRPLTAAWHVAKYVWPEFAAAPQQVERELVRKRARKEVHADMDAFRRELEKHTKV